MTPESRNPPTPPALNPWTRAVWMIALGVALYVVGGSPENGHTKPLALGLIAAAVVRAALQSAGYLRSASTIGTGLMDSLVLIALTLVFMQVFQQLGWGTE